MERDSDTNYNWCAPNNPQKFAWGTRSNGNGTMSRDYLN